MDLRQTLLFFLKEELKEVPNNQEWERVSKSIDALLLEIALIERNKK